MRLFVVLFVLLHNLSHAVTSDGEVRLETFSIAPTSTPMVEPSPSFEMAAETPSPQESPSLESPWLEESPAPADSATEVTPTETPIATSTPPPGRKVAVVVVNGGYNSCAGSVPTNGQIAADNYLTTVGQKAIEYVITPLQNQGYEVYWIISCFWGTTSTSLQVKTSTNGTFAAIVPWSGGAQPMFYSYLATQTQTFMGGHMEEMRLILIGHSNGGYNVLKLAEELSASVSFATLKGNSDTIFVRQVHTLDPISVACSPTNISVGLTWGGAMPPACLRAPTTTEVDYNKIQDEFDRLDNFYQLDYTTLHSGTIGSATSNAQVSLPGPQNAANNAHTRITGHDETWSSIRDRAVP